MTDPANNLREMLEFFVAGTEDVQYVDRHVFFDVPPDAEMAEEAAIELARLWAMQRLALAEHFGVSISSPRAIIDDDWLKGDIAGSPPHVYIVFAHPGAHVETGQDAATRLDGATGDDTIDQLLGRYGDSLIIWRLDPPDVACGENGAWLLEPRG